jgi:hypothetical protein
MTLDKVNLDFNHAIWKDNYYLRGTREIQERRTVCRKQSSIKSSIHGCRKVSESEIPRVSDGRTETDRLSVTARHKLTHHPKFDEENYTFALVRYRYR